MCKVALKYHYFCGSQTFTNLCTLDPYGLSQELTDI